MGVYMLIKNGGVHVNNWTAFLLTAISCLKVLSIGTINEFEFLN